MTHLATLTLPRYTTPQSSCEVCYGLLKAKTAIKAAFTSFAQCCGRSPKPFATTSGLAPSGAGRLCIAPRPYTIEKSAAVQVITYQTWLSAVYAVYFRKNKRSVFSAKTLAISGKK